MRIIGEIPHPKYKITILQHNRRTSVQIEHGLVQQTYKYRDGSGIESTEDVQRILTKDFLEKVDAAFAVLYENYYESLESDMEEDELGMEII